MAKMMIQSGIYQIRNLVNGKVYIGSAVNINARWNGHRSDLSGKKHRNIHLQLAWEKYGAANFVFEVLKIVRDVNDLLWIEQEYLDRIRPWDSNIGYNICTIAGSPLGTKLSPETKRKVSEASKSHWRDPEYREKQSRRKPTFAGKKHTEESIQKMSLSSSGKTHSIETRRRISESNRGRPVSSVTRQILSDLGKGQKRPNLSRLNKTPEARARASDRMKMYWAHKKSNRHFQETLSFSD